MKRLKLKMVLASLSIALFSANAQKATDLLSVPNVNYNGVRYQLNTSNQLSENHYKQTYLSNNENPRTFTTMVQMEVIYTQDSIQSIFKYKLKELESLKKANKIRDYSYSMNENTGEFTLNYLTSYEKNSALNLVEWNAYRYKSIPTENGSNGILLYTYTKRAYRHNCPTFLNDYNASKSQWISTLTAFALPTIGKLK